MTRSSNSDRNKPDEDKSSRFADDSFIELPFFPPVELPLPADDDSAEDAEDNHADKFAQRKPGKTGS